MHLAVNFHYVGMPAFPHPGIHGVSAADFRHHLETLVRAYEPVSLADVIAAACGGKALPDRSCLVTLDDGLRCQVECALPVLDDLGVPAAFFVMAGPLLTGQVPLVHKVHWCRAHFGNAAILEFIQKGRAEGWITAAPQEVDMAEADTLNPYDDEESSRLKYFLSRSVDHATADRIMEGFMTRMAVDPADFINRFYMSRAMIRDLAGRRMVGSHGVSHIPLASAPAAVVRAELHDSRACLEALSGGEVRALSYPYGVPDSVNPRVAAAAAAAGYVVAYTMERAWNESLNDPLLLARLDCRDIPRLAAMPPRSRYRVTNGTTPPAS